MKHLLLLALPIFLAGCPTPRPATPEAAAPAATDAGAAPAASDAPAVGDKKIEFANPGMIRAAATLPKRQWQLASAVDAGGKTIDGLFVRPAQPLTLDFRNRQLGIANACNRMHGNYALRGNVLTVDKLASTMMACADPRLQALDQGISKRLQGPLALRLSKGDASQLELTNGSGDVLVFTGQQTAESRYGGVGERVFLEVAADTRPCSHPLIADMQCLQVRELQYDDKGMKVGTPGAFGNFYDQIEGYTHQPGVRNVLRVKRYTRTNVPADASKHAYVLDMVVESEAPKAK